MKFFIDSAEVEAIKEAHALGMCDGVTTNPTLMYRAGVKDFEKHIKEICKVCDGPVSVEVISQNSDGMVKEAEKYATWAPNVVVKIPMTTEGLKAIRILKEKGIKTNTTLVFSANQALLAAKAGTDYVSPFVGRLDDIGEDGMDVVAEIVQIYKNYGFETEIIVASVRNAEHVSRSAKLGAHIATIPLNVITELAKHDLTDKGLKSFLEDWEKTGAKI